MRFKYLPCFVPLIMQISTIESVNLVKAKKLSPTTSITPKPIKEQADFIEYPFMAALIANKKIFCSSSIVNHHWTITAATCVEKHKNETIKVSYGNVDYRKGKIVMTETGQSNLTTKPGHDVVWIKTRKKINLPSKISTIKMWKLIDIFPIKQLIFISWPASQSSSKFMIIKNLTALPMDDCKNHYGHESSAKIPLAICIPNHNLFTQKNVGGPLLWESRANKQLHQIAVLSVPGNATSASIHTLVAPFWANMKKVVEKEQED